MWIMNMLSFDKMKKKDLLIMLAAALMLGACARQGYPTGGPKDVAPPVAGTAVPPSGTTNFAAQEFFVPFDEYVQIKDADNNVLISPPMRKKPEIAPKGKGVVVKIKDTLQSNTTYVIQFKGAIVDFNEGNALESYEYTFATGDAVDSMSYSGVVVDALTMMPREETITVALYGADAEDSVAAKEQPQYVTRCDKQGGFELGHIRAGRYRFLAFEDENNDMKLTAGEAVAFSDTLVCSVMKAAVADTTADTASVDQSLNIKPKKKLSLSPTDENRYLMSDCKVAAQRVVKSGFLRKGRVQIVMQSPMQEYSIEVLGGRHHDGKMVERLSLQRDTLDMWTHSGECDSVVMVLNTAERHDTLKMVYREPKKSRKGASFGASASSNMLRSKIGATTDYFDTLRLTFDNPLRADVCCDSVVELLNLNDSTVARVGIVLDSLRLGAVIPFALQQGVRYEVRVDKDVLTDMYGNKNDSLKVATEVSRAEEYGSILLVIEGSGVKQGGKYQIELLDEKLAVKRSAVSIGTGRVVFEHLKPGKYRVRAIVDDNADGKWNGGDYWQHKQPEKVVYFEKTLDLRANWDIEEKFTF